MPETHTGHSRRNGRHFDYGAACGVTGADPFFIAGQRAQHGRQEHSVITAGLARQIGEQNFKAASIAGAGHVQGSQRAVAGMHRAVQDGGRKFHAFELGSRGENLCGQGWHAVAHAVHAADQDALRLPGRGCVHAPRDKPRGLQRSDEARHKGIVRIQAEIPVLPAVSGSQAGQEAKSLEEPVCAEQTVGMSVRKFIDMRQRAPGHEAFRGTPKHVNGGRADGERAGAAGDERDFLAVRPARPPPTTIVSAFWVDRAFPRLAKDEASGMTASGSLKSGEKLPSTSVLAASSREESRARFAQCTMRVISISRASCPQ